MGDAKGCGPEFSIAVGLRGNNGSENISESTRPFGLENEVGAVDFAESRSDNAVGLEEVTRDSEMEECRG